MDGQTLANHQSISATVENAKGHTTSNTTQHAYQVDTEAPPQPVSSIDALTGDNVINRSEAQGSVTVRARHHLIQETAAAKQIPPKKATAVLS